MVKKILTLICLCSIFLALSTLQAQKGKHTFVPGNSEFLLDGQPFQVISGEMHPARIPAEYWRHRIQMAKAMGCNTLITYIFWNYHEPEEGVYDFSSGNHNLGEFLNIAKEEGMWLILNPGPRVNADWELGGIPPYLLRIPDIRLHYQDLRYLSAVEKYLARLSMEIKPYLVSNGGPVLMLLTEDECGSYDKDNIKQLKENWVSNGINVPLLSFDELTERLFGADTHLLNVKVPVSATTKNNIKPAEEMNSDPASSKRDKFHDSPEHWGEKWEIRDSAELLKKVRFFLDSRKSFILSVINGGTNFGYTAGSNSDGNGFEALITTYDKGAPITEQGQPTPTYLALRDMIGSYLPKGKKLISIPHPIPAFEISPVDMQPFTAVWDNLPKPVISVQTKTFDTLNQDYGYILYRTELTGEKYGKLIVKDIHDYATVFLNGAYIGKLDRQEGLNSIELPYVAAEVPILEIFVESMGRLCSGNEITERKGITEYVSLNGKTLLNWKIYNLPMDKKFIYGLRSSGKFITKPGIFFKGNFVLAKSEGNVGADTYIDFSGFVKGMIWINGHNLGRFWNIGPQKRLYCPSPWLREGINEIMLLDLHRTERSWLYSAKKLE